MICVGLRSDFAIDGKIVQCWRRPVARPRCAITSHTFTRHFHGAAEGNLDLQSYATGTIVCTASPSPPTPLLTVLMRSCFYFHFHVHDCRQKHALECHFDFGFNHGVVSARVTTLSVDRGCYLKVPFSGHPAA
jgi:hypothetical protein